MQKAKQQIKQKGMRVALRDSAGLMPPHMNPAIRSPYLTGPPSLPSLSSSLLTSL